MVGLRYRRVGRIDLTGGEKSIVGAGVVAGFQNVSAKNRNTRVVRSRSANGDPHAAAILNIFQKFILETGGYRNQVRKNDECVFRERKAGSLRGTRGINRESRFGGRGERCAEINERG